MKGKIEKGFILLQGIVEREREIDRERESPFRSSHLRCVVTFSVCAKSSEDDDEGGLLSL